MRAQLQPLLVSNDLVQNIRRRVWVRQHRAKTACLVKKREGNNLSGYGYWQRRDALYLRPRLDLSHNLIHEPFDHGKVLGVVGVIASPEQPPSRGCLLRGGFRFGDAQGGTALRGKALGLGVRTLPLLFKSQQEVQAFEDTS